MSTAIVLMLLASAFVYLNVRSIRSDPRFSEFGWPQAAVGWGPFNRTLDQKNKIFRYCSFFGDVFVNWEYVAVDVLALSVPLVICGAACEYVIRRSGSRRVHVLTLLMTLLVAAGILWLNVRSKRVVYTLDGNGSPVPLDIREDNPGKSPDRFAECRGFPIWFLISNSNGYFVNAYRMAFAATVDLSILAVFLAATEFIFRRRDRQRVAKATESESPRE